jgi:hypothetical protein
MQAADATLARELGLRIPPRPCAKTQRPPRVPAPLTGRLSESPSRPLQPPTSLLLEMPELDPLSHVRSPTLRNRGALDCIAPPQATQSEAPSAHLFHTMPHLLPPTVRYAAPCDAARRESALPPHHLSNLDSLLNSGYDNGMLERAASAQAPEPHLPFHATVGDGDRRYPRLGGQELYSSLLGSLRESIDRRMRLGAPASHRDSSFALESMPSALASAGPVKQCISMDSALARLQMSVEDGVFGPHDVLPVHRFLPNVRVCPCNDTFSVQRSIALCCRSLTHHSFCWT